MARLSIRSQEPIRRPIARSGGRRERAGRVKGGGAAEPSEGTLDAPEHSPAASDRDGACVESCGAVRVVGLHGGVSKEGPRGCCIVLELAAAAEPVTATVDHADIRGLATTLLVSVKRLPRSRLEDRPKPPALLRC